MTMKYLVLSSAVSLLIFSPVHPNPVLSTYVYDPDNPPPIPKDYCNLTPRFGNSGSTKFVEECENLDVFPTLPMPGSATHKYGIHPMVCCPKISNISICFPTDTFCPSYVTQTTTAPKVNSEPIEQIDCTVYECVTPKAISVNNNIPKISDEDCTEKAKYWGNTTQCVDLNDCPGIFRQPFNPLPTKDPSKAGLCGWNNEDKTVKVCCPGTEIQHRTLRQVVEPRFPGYQCHDKVKQCKQWKKNNGCRIDMDFIIDPDEQDNGRANSGLMFDFMMGTCMETCGQCGDKGCRDEHPDCLEWARQGFCITMPTFMVHTCRESCGVCGFLSTDDYKEQAAGENTYTDFRISKFDCGRYKPLSEIHPKEMEEELLEINFGEEDNFVDEIRSEKEEKSKLREKRQNSADEDVDVFFSNDSGNKFCGATLIADRWVITASHCYDEFGGTIQVKVNTIRDNTPYKEIIEIKRIYKHPKYVYPNLYNDIALLELGRRVHYNWDKYGDSPMCIDRVGQNEGKTATVQGYGLTENYIREGLLETNVTVISNSQCKTNLEFNTTGKPTIQSRIKYGLPNGLNDKMFCAQGTENEEGFIRGSCVGDSGGPLFVQRSDGRQMLVGIVSGGFGCGHGYPNWFTKVAFFTSWIECIIDNTKIYESNKKKVEKECKALADEAEAETSYDYIFEDQDTVYYY